MSLAKEQTLYISDLDGTLLRPDATLSAFTRDAILRVLDHGVHFTVATARSVTSTIEILGDIPFRLPVICANGGAIYEYHTRSLMDIEYIPAHIASEVVGEIKARGDTAFVSAVVEGREKVFYDALPNGGMEWYFQDRLDAGDDRVTRVEDIRHCDPGCLTTITFMNRMFHIDGNRRYFSRKYRNRLRLNYFENKYSPGWHWLSMHSPNSNKAGAIDRLRKMAGLADCRVTVFGDELNDISMFERADRAVAVANAMPEVRQLAHEIIGHGHEDAVAGYLLRAHGLH